MKVIQVVAVMMRFETLTCVKASTTPVHCSHLANICFEHQIICIFFLHLQLSLQNTMWLSYLQNLQFVKYKENENVEQTNFFSSMHRGQVNFLRKEECFLNALVHIYKTHSDRDNIRWGKNFKKSESKRN